MGKINETLTLTDQFSSSFAWTFMQSGAGSRLFQAMKTVFCSRIDGIKSEIWKPSQSALVKSEENRKGQSIE